MTQLFDPSWFAPGPTEPSADARTAARSMWDWHSAYLAAGFSEEQSTYLLGQTLNGMAMGAAFAAGMKGGDDS